MYPVTEDLLTNQAYGNYGGRPRGSKRRVSPTLLMCIHITSNKQNLGPDAAQNERNYANRPNSEGPSAHDYINRDGSVIHAIDTTYTAWSNGDVKTWNPNPAANDIIKTIKQGIAQGYNPNELFVREVECVGYGAAHPMTAEQKLTIAQLLAKDSKKSGIAISRATVGMHRDINTTTRPNCPFDVKREEQLAAIITAANAIVALGE